MSYLLLLALVLVAGLIIIQLSLPVGRQSPSQTFLLIGFIFIGVCLVTELVLGFTLDETAAKLFYWTRGSLALAWIGQSLLLFLSSTQLRNAFNHRARWLSIGIVIASLGMLVLIFLTRVTDAQDWYSPAKPIFGQIGDLLATNRPTRWGALALNLYGLAILIAGSIFFLLVKTSKKVPESWISVTFIILGAIGLFVPLYWPPAQANLFFYLVELLAPPALFFGLKTLATEVSVKHQQL